jgi:hypothetical protein
VTTDPAEVLDRAPIRGERLKHRDAVRLKQRWRETFATPLYQAEGARSIGSHDWHVFSHGYSRHTAGAEALTLYEQQVSTNLLVILDPDLVVLAGDFDAVPHAAPGHDVYVCDAELNWTMVFTHEPKLGPTSRERIRSNGWREQSRFRRRSSPSANSWSPDGRPCGAPALHL